MLIEIISANNEHDKKKMLDYIEYFEKKGISVHTNLYCIEDGDMDGQTLFSLSQSVYNMCEIADYILFVGNENLLYFDSFDLSLYKYRSKFISDMSNHIIKINGSLFVKDSLCEDLIDHEFTFYHIKNKKGCIFVFDDDNEKLKNDVLNYFKYSEEYVVSDSVHIYNIYPSIYDHDCTIFTFINDPDLVLQIVRSNNYSVYAHKYNELYQSKAAKFTINTTVTIENELGSGTNNIEMNYTFFKVLGER